MSDNAETKLRVNLKSVNFKLALYSKITGLYIFTSILLIMMCVYVVYILINLYIKWLGRKKRLESYIKEKLNQSDVSSFNTKVINYGRKEDEEVYSNGTIGKSGNSGNSGGVDDYYKFDDNINSIITSYKSAKKDCKDEGKVSPEEKGDVEPERAFIDPSYDDYKKD